jgi:hypothetical protein
MYPTFGIARFSAEAHKTNDLRELFPSGRSYQIAKLKGYIRKAIYLPKA